MHPSTRDALRKEAQGSDLRASSPAGFVSASRVFGARRGFFFFPSPRGGPHEGLKGGLPGEWIQADDGSSGAKAWLGGGDLEIGSLDVAVG